LEFLPHSYYDAASKTVKWRIPLGSGRTISDGSKLHETVNEKLRIDPSYRPSNLPEISCEEPKRACKFGREQTVMEGEFMKGLC
jgi:hypothetical protein